ncbi:MAG: aldo/keto reductase [Pirellulales bacterium]|nr:aldo/keto reductase [Pirellulales bacterium]
MSNISRRQFLAGTSAAGVAALTGRFSFAAEKPPRPARGTDLVALGRSGLKTTVLGIGTGTRGGREQRELQQSGFTRLVRDAYDRGVRYIDTADAYGTHPLVRPALRGLPREQIFIQTKTRAKDAATAKADIERFLKELDCEYIDSLLMHCMTRADWPTDMRPVMDVLSEAKQQKRVRAVGISSHGMDPLVASVDCDWIDIQLARINPFGDKMDGPAEQVAGHLKKMHEKGRGVIGMKIYGETGFDTAEKRYESLKYVLGLGSVDAFTIGFVNVRQIDETLEMIETALAELAGKRPAAAVSGWLDPSPAVMATC